MNSCLVQNLQAEVADAHYENALALGWASCNHACVFYQVILMPGGFVVGVNPVIWVIGSLLCIATNC